MEARNPMFVLIAFGIDSCGEMGISGILIITAYLLTIQYVWKWSGAERIISC